MAILQPNVDYTAKDFRALRLRLQGLVRSVYPEWTDFNSASFGNILLELQAYVGDMVAFYQDAQARDTYWSTVVQRENAIKLGRMINYRLPSATPATSTARFSTPTAVAVEVPIPEGTKVRTADENSVAFRTTAAGSILVGQSFVDIPVEQATLVQNEGFASTGAPNQRYVTVQSPVIDGTVTVEAIDGVYLEVDSFLDPDPLTSNVIDSDSRVFVSRSDAFGRKVLIFGDGQVGKIPEGSVDITYKIGGGVQGNVDAGEIIILEDSIFDLSSNVAPVSVTNPVKASGGVPAVSVAEARVKGPQSLRVLERSVTKEDFEIHAEQIPGVARAVMVTSNEDASVQENEGVVLLVAKGEELQSGRIAPSTPSSSTINAVLQKVTVDKPPTITFSVTVAAAPFREINHSMIVYLESGTSATTVGENIRNALADFYAVQLSNGTANPDIDFGANIKQADGTTISEIAWSDVFNAIRDADGVRKVDEGPQGLLLNGLRSSVTLGPRDFPALGTVSIINGDTGGAI